MTAFSFPAPVTAAVASALIASAPDARSATIAKHTISPATSAIIKVHDSWDDDWDGRPGQHYHHHHYYPDTIVDAPFTHVETGRHVIVDAPFTHVYVGPYGRHIVAPFVDIWVPR